MKKHKDNKGILLNKGINESRLIYLNDGIDFEIDYAIEVDDDINGFWHYRSKDNRDLIIICNSFGDTRDINL